MVMKWTAKEIKILERASSKDIVPDIKGREKRYVRNKMLSLKLLNSRIWNNKEIETLKDAASKGIIPEIKGKNQASIKRRMYRLKLIKSQYWTDEEVAIIQNNQGKIPQIAGRTDYAVKLKMASLGLMNSKKWKKSELEILKKYSDANGILPKVPGRSQESVKIKLYRMGLKRTKVWSKEEIENLKCGKVRSNRSKSAIKSKMIRLGMVETKPSRPEWPDQHISLLRDLHNQGKSAHGVFNLKVLPYTLNAIQKKLCRLGMAKKLKIVRFPMDIQERFKSFLLSNWAGKTPKDLMLLWNKANAKFSVNNRRVISNLVKLKIKISNVEVKRINGLRKREQEIISKNVASSSDLLEKIRRERIKLMRIRLEGNKDIWTGLESPELLEDSLV
jgi:hypothetical protein